jgi:peptidoglycan/xylan/chitin deacetylase (PgdA/CDA1 family)
LLYFVKSPYWLQKIYKSCFWKVKTNENEVFLTFDDGPHPQLTTFVLEQLKKYNAKASFFCIGDNVQKFPEVYKSIIEEGHAVGNHTHNHLNGWENTDELYIENVNQAKKIIKSKLFRPPYGRIKFSQLRKIRSGNLDFIPVMWSILSGDFDNRLSGKQCYLNVVNNIEKGAIVVFHDSEKAKDRLTEALPMVLEKLTKEGYVFKSLSTA